MTHCPAPSVRAHWKEVLGRGDFATAMNTMTFLFEHDHILGLLDIICDMVVVKRQIMDGSWSL